MRTYDSWYIVRKKDRKKKKKEGNRMDGRREREKASQPRGRSRRTFPHSPFKTSKPLIFYLDFTKKRGNLDSVSKVSI